MYNFSNGSKFGIKNDTERYLWTGWLTFVFLSSLLGDSLILLASIKYKAFNLHKMIVTFIQHIAVNDLLNTLGSVAPAMLSAIFNTGGPSRFIDYARSFILYYTAASSSVFISALVLGKLLFISYYTAASSSVFISALVLGKLLFISYYTAASSSVFISALVLGKLLFISYYTAASSSVFISALVLGKLLLLRYPLKLRSVSKKDAHKLCAGIWIFCIFVPVLHLGIDKDDVIFDYRTYSCTYGYTSTLWRILLPVSAVLILIAPGVGVVVSTVLILKEARKLVRRTRENLRWQGITTVVLTATVYVIAFLPYTIYFMAEPFVKKDPDEPGVFYVEFFRVANGILEFHILSNFLSTVSLSLVLEDSWSQNSSRFFQRAEKTLPPMVMCFLFILNTAEITPHLRLITTAYDNSYD